MAAHPGGVGGRAGLYCPPYVFSRLPQGVSFVTLVLQFASDVR